ncbi:MAG TPA: L,D-transpeptidase family protein [Kofleriaceae bacterium]|nr:L,D-transpeptidase family protein [Kofleriaceae bacterium]
MRVAAITIAVLGTWALPGPTARADDAVACDADQTAIVVDTATRVLTLCEKGAAVATFPVAIGGGGVGKVREGDDKTPLGTYRLGAPRASSDYGTFIPVGFPTKAQKKAGITGGSIGVHGPDRRLRALGRVAVALGWTRGCVAVSSDVEMRSIVRWMGRRALSIEIR